MSNDPNAATRHNSNRPARRRRKVLLWAGLIPAAGLSVLVVGIHLWMVASTRQWVFDSPRDLPANQVGLVLGTDPHLSDGSPSPFFKHRNQATLELYNRGKIRQVLASGVGGKVSGDPILAMRDSLVELGIPAPAIVLDGDGDRTLDSIVRAREVFGLRRVTLITQRFHCYRAVYLARYYGLDAVAYCVPTTPRRGSSSGPWSASTSPRSKPSWTSTCCTPCLATRSRSRHCRHSPPRLGRDRHLTGTSRPATAPPTISPPPWPARDLSQ